MLPTQKECTIFSCPKHSKLQDFASTLNLTKNGSYLMIIASKLHPKNIIPHLWLNVIPGKKQCTSIILLFFEFQPILPILLSSNFLDLPTYKNPRPGNSQASKSYMILRRLQPASRAIPWGLRLKQPFWGDRKNTSNVIGSFHQVGMKI